MNKSTRHILFLRLALWGSLVIIGASTLGTAIHAERKVQQMSVNRFDKAVDMQQTHILERMERYADLLYSGRAFLVADANVSQKAWETFMREQDAFERYTGISSITYLKLFGNDEKQAFLQQMRAQPFFGGESFAIRPEGTREKYAVVQFVSSDNDVSSSFGFDVYSGAERRQAMDLAVETALPQATPPYELATGFQGFAVFLPVYRAGNLDGFSLLSFRVDDFVSTLLNGDEPGLNYKITDISDENEPQVLHRSDNWQDEADGLKRSDALDVLGRQWEITFAASNRSNISWQMRILPGAVLAVGTLVVSLLITAIILTDRRLSRRA